MIKPSFEDWIKMKGQCICTAFVLCTDGATQEIKECIFGYGLATKKEMITKRGYLVSDFFFVKRLIDIKDFHETRL